MFTLFQILQTIQMFTNQVGPVVESLKYVSNLGYDVLVCKAFSFVYISCFCLLVQSVIIVFSLID